MNIGLSKFTILVSILFSIGLFLPSSQANPPQLEERCTAEAGACGKCGDGFCNKRCGETSASCPKDCGTGSESVQLACGKCGDGYCSKTCGENARSCPRDCADRAADSATPAKQ
jgi:hypothetical protein